MNESKRNKYFFKRLSKEERELCHNMNISYEDYYLSKLQMKKQGKQECGMRILKLSFINFRKDIRNKWFFLKWNIEDFLDNIKKSPRVK